MRYWVMGRRNRRREEMEKEEGNGGGRKKLEGGDGAEKGEMGRKEDGEGAAVRASGNATRTRRAGGVRRGQLGSPRLFPLPSRLNPPPRAKYPPWPFCSCCRLSETTCC